MKEIQFYWNVMKKGVSKGEINTFHKKIKYIGRNLLYYPWSKRIANFIQNHTYLSKEVYRYPVLCSKIHRPYITQDFTLKKKVEVILDSYQYIDSFFLDSVLAELYKTGEIKILELEGKEGKKVSTYFRLYTNYEKEGEFNLVLYQEEVLLATLTFSVWNHVLFIGGLQGLARDNKDTEILKAVTKDFYGLFPKRLLLEIFYQLFSEEKIAVGNKNHIYLAARYRYKEKRKIHADYDEFWESLGGLQEESGLWKLPKTLVRKSMEEIPSKKRSQYRSRYGILDQLEGLVSNFLINTKKNRGGENS